MNKNDRQSTSWESFWKENPTGFNSTMLRNTTFFGENLNKESLIQATDRILDIGCGPGFLIDYLKDKCEYVHGTDISEKYIEICRQKYAYQKGLGLSVSKIYDFKAYAELIVDHRINRVVMLSVLQYYQSETEVRELILTLKKESGGHKFSLLLADIIPVKHSAYSDILSLIKHAIKSGFTITFVRFLIYAVFSDYRKMKNTGLLQLDERFFLSLAEELNVTVKIIKDLTMHAGRYSVMFNWGMDPLNE